MSSSDVARRMTGGPGRPGCRRRSRHRPARPPWGGSLRSSCVRTCVPACRGRARWTGGFRSPGPVRWAPVSPTRAGAATTGPPGRSPAPPATARASRATRCCPGVLRAGLCGVHPVLEAQPQRPAAHAPRPGPRLVVDRVDPEHRDDPAHAGDAPGRPRRDDGIRVVDPAQVRRPHRPPHRPGVALPHGLRVERSRRGSRRLPRPARRQASEERRSRGRGGASHQCPHIDQQVTPGTWDRCPCSDRRSISGHERGRRWPAGAPGVSVAG